MIADGPDSRTCSRAACHERASWAISWRNPRIHGPERRKVWVACAAHVDYLSQYLRARDFPVEIAALEEATT